MHIICFVCEITYFAAKLQLFFELCKYLWKNLCISIFFCTFVPDMRRTIFLIIALTLALVSCNKPSRVEQHKAEKHVQDSIRLEEQVRSLAYYEGELDRLLPVSDSLIALFKYERNEKYQDHGYFVTNGRNGLRILVRDDGKDLMLYQNGKRIPSTDDPKLEQAQHLQIVISDIKELEKRIAKTSLEVQKYQKRLQKE